MRTTIDIEADLLKQLRAEALRRGVRFKEVVADALRRGLAERRAAYKAAGYSCPTFAMGTPGSVDGFDKALRIAGELEDHEITRRT